MPIGSAGLREKVRRLRQRKDAKESVMVHGISVYHTGCTIRRTVVMTRVNATTPILKEVPRHLEPEDCRLCSVQKIVHPLVKGDAFCARHVVPAVPAIADRM